MSPLTAASTSSDWLRPIGFGAQDQAAWTRLGTLDGHGEPIIDPRGVLQVAPGRPGVSWWIAGDDRWYFPSREPTVRQSVVHATPVIETRVRVKGGDICQRAYAVTVPAPDGSAEAVVLEFENASGVPCGVAFALGPFGVVAPAPIHRVALEGGVLLADGEPAVVLPRPPAAALAGTAEQGDLSVRVARGEARSASVPPTECSAGLAQLAVVVPLAHRSVFRVVVPIPDTAGRLGDEAGTYPSAVAPSEHVARGWRAQVRTAARAKVPDPRLGVVLDAAPTWLLATTAGADAAIGRSIWDPRRSPRWGHVAAVAGALDRVGLHQRAGALLARATTALDTGIGDEADGMRLVEAYAIHLDRTCDVEFASAVAEASTRLVAPLLGRRPLDLPASRRRRTLEAAMKVLDVAGERRAVRAVARAVGPIEHAAEEGVEDSGGGTMLTELDRAAVALRGGRALLAWEVLDDHLDHVTSTGVWPADAGDPDRHSVGVGAAIVSLAWDLLAHFEGGTALVARYVPDAWQGVGFDVHDLATPSGRFGYAVRWHETRPALLWELGNSDAARPVAHLRIEAPGLDPNWEGRGSSGEALLDPAASAGPSRRAGSTISGLQIGSTPNRTGT